MIDVLVFIILAPVALCSVLFGCAVAVGIIKYIVETISSKKAK